MDDGFLDSRKTDKMLTKVDRVLVRNGATRPEAAAVGMSVFVEAVDLSPEQILRFADRIEHFLAECAEAAV